MKTTLILLIAGLFFLTTPMLATAGERDGRDRQSHYKGWVKNDRHDQKSHYSRHDNRRDHHYNQRRNHQAKKNLRRELRETRQELRQVKRQIRNNHRRPYYARHNVNPAILLGLPHLVFQFDW